MRNNNGRDPNERVLKTFNRFKTNMKNKENVSYF